ncbi:hypothetical protein [Fusobacterium sp. SYSU M8D902]|uniref:hypothetical protein n=1 Tax=Fusobacterium sp. SYSU M8D902 TaxID=3159562 RepID=UPI0032E51EB8
MISRIKNILKEKDIFYFITILILIFHNYTSNIYGVDLKKVNTLVLMITIVLFLNSVKDKIKINFKELVKYFILIFGLIFGLRSLYLSFFILGISIFIDKRIRIRYFLQINTFFYVLTIILYKIGYLVEVENPLIRIGRMRYSLGFAHPNTAMMFLLPIFFTIYYLYYPKYKNSIIFFILVNSLVIFFFTFSRTTFILIILFIGLIFFKDKTIEKLRKLFLMEGIMIILLSLVLPIILNTENIINRLLSGRLFLFYKYLITYKITVFGDMQILEQYSSWPLDNSYLRVLFENGIIGLLLLLLLSYLIMITLFKNKDYKGVRIFSILLILGFMEGNIFHFYFNILCFILPEYVNKAILKLKN